MVVISLLVIITGGCSEKEKEKPDNIPVSSVNEKQTEEVLQEEVEVEKVNEQQISSAESILDEIQNIVIPNSEETFIAQQPGLFTADIPYEKETKQVWGNFGLGDYKEELTDKLGVIAAETQEPELIFKALHYYVGSNAYGQVAAELDDFSMDWFEPYLPEPGELEGAKEQETVEPGKAMILLDASSSMLLNVQGKQKMGIAKRATSRFASTIGMSDDVSLVVYGHAGTQNQSDKELSCTTIEEVYPMGPFKAKEFKEAVDGVQAKGWTPIAEAIKFAREHTSDSTGKLTVYIVSDGAETCGGDPIAEAKAFAEESTDRQVNIIGFDVDSKGEQQLKAVAEAGKGEYISAKTIEELDQSITEQWLPSLNEIMSKSNSLLKQWGQLYTEMVDRSNISSRFLYATLNESDRMHEALRSMHSEKWITPEIQEEVQEMIQVKKDKAIEVQDALDARARIRVENERKAIVERVDKWTDRMFELRESQGK
ncbi:vWA domain-containing protein [Sporosarcina obsidiansis]|uniref:vWA domain-containing protein n=1 Tax=Sporosarcina obsidiansis TaxID=2660748 RepID=UPI00129A1286|nr:VWA domain-containing protein [Sporosarcina obsidiansis]